MAETSCVIRIDGKDISSDIDPYLLSLSVTDKAGMSSDTCTIKLDDRNGQILFPRDGVSIEILLGRQGQVSRVFAGTVDEVRWSTSRSEGTTLTISGKGVDTKGKAKEPKRKHWDDKSIQDVMTDACKAAGIDSVSVAPALASIKRPYWAQQNESLLHFGERIAREIGGTFKIQSGKAILVERNGGKSASGSAMPVFTARYGQNLISVDIAPTIGRPRYKSVKTRSYDPKTGTWKEQTQEISDDGAQAVFSDRYSAADSGEAEERAKSHKKDSESGKGSGTITVDGDATPQPEGFVTLVGARPGIDGSYGIEGVTHDFSRSSGWTTRIDLKQPQGDAGKDMRGAAKRSGS